MPAGELILSLGAFSSTCGAEATVAGPSQARRPVLTEELRRCSSLITLQWSPRSGSKAKTVKISGRPWVPGREGNEPVLESTKLANPSPWASSCSATMANDACPEGVLPSSP